MKKLMLSSAIIGSLAGAAWSQTATQDLFRTEMAQGDIRASDLIGMRIYASEAPVQGDTMNGMQDGWNDIGEVNDVILSRDGSVQAVLVDIGGFLGMGERQVAVQMTSLKMLNDDATSDDPDDFFLVLNANRGALENAPSFSDASMSGAGEVPGDQQSKVAEGGLSDGQPPVKTNADGTAVDGAMATTNDQSAPATTGQADVDAQAGSDAVEATGTEGSITTDGTTATMTDGSASAAGTADGHSTISRDGYAAAAPDALTAERLTSAPVYDAQDTRIGEIADLILDDAGKVTDVVFDVGGFLGIGEKRVALPISEVNILKQSDGTELRVYVQQTEDQLKEMSAYKG